MDDGLHSGVGGTNDLRAYDILSFGQLLITDGMCYAAASEANGTWHAKCGIRMMEYPGYGILFDVGALAGLSAIL